MGYNISIIILIIIDCFQFFYIVQFDIDLLVHAMNALSDKPEDVVTKQALFDFFMEKEDVSLENIDATLEVLNRLEKTVKLDVLFE